MNFFLGAKAAGSLQLAGVRLKLATLFCGSAAPQCGQAMPYWAVDIGFEAVPPFVDGRRSLQEKFSSPGKHSLTALESGQAAEQRGISRTPDCKGT